MPTKWLIVPWALLLILAVAIGATILVRKIIDRRDNHRDTHEGVTEKGLSGLYVPTQEHPVLFVVPQEWIDRYAGKPAGRHRAQVLVNA